MIVITEEKKALANALMDAKKYNLWNPNEVINETRYSIKKGINRIKKSKNADGGWGFYWQTSDFWSTAYTLLCLNYSKKIMDVLFEDVDINLLIGKGLDWISDIERKWKRINYSNLSIYEISLFIKCVYEMGSGYFDKDILSDISQCKERLIHFQNENGGWDTALWEGGKNKNSSEVGSTSAVLCALAKSKNKEEIKEHIIKGVRWLMQTQSFDGSWKEGIYDESRNQMRGVTSHNKTCDALKGILSAKFFEDEGIINDIEFSWLYKESINRALEWLKRRSQSISSSDNFAVEQTCLTLETLLKLPEISFAFCTSLARGLIKKQYSSQDLDDGKWEYELTPRVTLSLIEYYGIINEFFD